MPRRLVIQSPSGSYDAGTEFRLFGPDEAGALNSAAPVQAGKRLVHGPAEPSSWLEEAWLGGPWLEPRRYAGWLGNNWLEGPWLEETEPVWLVTEPLEHGAVEVGMQAGDIAGSSSISPATVCVVSAPERPRPKSIAVAGGRVTVSL